MRFYALALLALITGCAEEQKVTTKEIAKPVKLMTVNDGSNAVSNILPGKVIAGEEATITFEVSGKLSKLPVKEGQKIKKGEIIAQLNQKDYRFTYEKQLATFTENQSSYARAKELIKNKYISQADFDSKKKAFEVAKADLSIAERNLNNTILKAPFNGTIAKVYVDNYQNIQRQEKIVTLQNLDFIDVKINVPENKIIKANNIKTLSLDVTFDADPNTQFPAKLYEMANQADTATQTYQATVRLKRPKHLNILPGMTAKVKSVATTKLATLKFEIPADAIFADNQENSYVWVINQDSRLEKRQVKTKSLANNKVTISQGLNIGERIVIAGVNFLQENQLVTKYSK